MGRTTGSQESFIGELGEARRLARIPAVRTISRCGGRRRGEHARHQRVRTDWLVAKSHDADGR
jgi:hypothetical protein